MKSHRVFGALLAVLLLLFVYESYIYASGPEYAHRRMMEEMMGIPTPFLGLTLRSWALFILLAIFAYSVLVGTGK